jgi:hypothetical protein
MKSWLGLALAGGVLAAAGGARADPIRILVAVSHSKGADGELPLRHADHDTREVSDVLDGLGGFRRDPTLRLVDPTVADVVRAFDRARAVAAGHPPEEVTFVFYFSGHGDRERIHLGEESILMTDLAERARTIPAALRVLVTDACRNYPGRPKGISTEPGFSIGSDESGSSKGVVWLFASSDGEAAQESDELEGALFTHYWVSGLRGAADSNGDGRVTLAESYEFAYSQTLLRSARGNGVLQHPAAMFALREAAPIVLTETFGRGARIELPQSADTRYLVYALGAHVVLGEIWGRPDRRATFALPSGRYIVARRAPNGSSAAEIALATGETRTLDVSDFRHVAEEQVASKGGSLDLQPDELGVEFGAGASRIEDFGGGVGVRFARRFDHWALSFSLGAGLGDQHTPAENVHTASVFGDAVLERRIRLGSPILGVGLGVEVLAVRQTLERTDAAQVMLGGYPTSEEHFAWAPGPIGLVRLREPLGKGFWVDVEGRGGVLLTTFGSSIGPLWTVRGGVGAGFDF